MFKIIYSEPFENETIDEITFNNLKEADKHCKLDTFLLASTAWLKNNKNNKDRDYNKLEQFLRYNNFNTHLIAREIKLSNDYMFSLPNDNKNNELKYECLILCKPMDGTTNKEEYLKEISKYSSSYDENLEKLKYAGTLTSKTIKNEVNKDSIAYKISNSKIKIKYENISTQDFILEIESNIENKFGQKPNLNLFAKKDDGTDIYAFFIDKLVVCEYGVEIIVENNLKKKKIIDLKNYNII
jgi:hypothetical protein